MNTSEPLEPEGLVAFATGVYWRKGNNSQSSFATYGERTVQIREDSIAEILSRVHAKLLGDLRAIAQVIRPFSREGLDGLRARLRTIRRDLIQHFNLEEQNGYMDIVRKREPRLARAVDKLAGEHQQLRQSLDSLLAEAKVASRLTDRIREHTRQWIQSLRRHELRETALVQDVFDSDISAED